MIKDENNLNENKEIVEYEKKLNQLYLEMQEKLDLPDGYIVEDIIKVDNMPLATKEEILQKEAYLVKVRKDDGSYYYINVNENLDQIQTIETNGKVELTEKQEEKIKDVCNPDDEMYIEQNEETNEIEKTENKEEKEKNEIAEKLNKEPDDIASVLEISKENSDTVAEIYNNSNLHGEKIKIVRYTNNQCEILDDDNNKIQGIESTEVSLEILHAMNVKYGKNAQAKDYELKSGSSRKNLNPDDLILIDVGTSKIIIEHDVNGNSRDMAFNYKNEKIDIIDSTSKVPNEINLEGEKVEIKGKNTEVEKLADDVERQKLLEKIIEVENEIDEIEKKDEKYLPGVEDNYKEDLEQRKDELVYEYTEKYGEKTEKEIEEEYQRTPGGDAYNRRYNI